MSDKEKIFADGFSFKTRPNQPDFVVGRMSIKLEDALPFLKENAKNGWVNLNINIARSGNPYVELDTFVHEKKQEEAEPVKAEEKLPF